MRRFLLVAALAALPSLACNQANQAPPAFRWTPEVKPSTYSRSPPEPPGRRRARPHERQERAGGQPRAIARGQPRVVALNPDPLAYEDRVGPIVEFPQEKAVLQAPLAKGAHWTVGGPPPSPRLTRSPRPPRAATSSSASASRRSGRTAASSPCSRPTWAGPARGLRPRGRRRDPGQQGAAPQLPRRRLRDALAPSSSRAFTNRR